MNTATLDELIDRYETNIDVLYGDSHDELFKWRALKTFQDEWFSDRHPDFISRFKAATKDFSVFIDNSRMHPRNGVQKLYEKNAHEVERLFCDVLFADDGGDLCLRQQNMDAFIDGMEQLRKQYYPAQWSFKQDRHSASTFLAMYAPTGNYVYKFSEAETMAVYCEFGNDIGSGADFKLQHYYRMCDEIAERLKEHDSLLKKHFDRLDGSCCDERSLHLLAFDLIYCCRTYGYYRGLSHAPKRETIRRAENEEKRKEAAAVRQERTDALAGEIEELELSLPDVSDISLINVEVTSKNYGVGTVIEHELNRIKVQFSDAVKSFILDNKFLIRPHFENDTEVVNAYSEYTAITQKIDYLKKCMEQQKKE